MIDIDNIIKELQEAASECCEGYCDLTFRTNEEKSLLEIELTDGYNHSWYSREFDLDDYKNEADLLEDIHESIDETDLDEHFAMLYNGSSPEYRASMPRVSDVANSMKDANETLGNFDEAVLSLRSDALDLERNSRDETEK